MLTNDNRNAAASADFSAFHLGEIQSVYSTPDRAEAVGAIIFELWRVSEGKEVAWRLSSVLASTARLIGGERLCREDRDQILIAVEQAREGFVHLIFDRDGLADVVEDALKALAALAVWWEQDYMARATRDPAEIAALLARARLCRLEMDAVVRRADRAQRAVAPVVAFVPVKR